MGWPSGTPWGAPPSQVPKPDGAIPEEVLDASAGCAPGGAGAACVIDDSSGWAAGAATAPLGVWKLTGGAALLAALAKVGNGPRSVVPLLGSRAMAGGDTAGGSNGTGRVFNGF